MTPDVAALVEGVLAGRRDAVARAITLVESSHPAHRAWANPLVEELAQQASRNRPTTIRVGISGLPGVGKSTFVEALGTRLTAAGHRVGVLAVDPSSLRTGGSVLGDKTRMPRLAADPAAYVRPSPTAGTLGGVTRATTQAITILEAAEYDVVLVETVGVGQSEVAVAGMVDTFLFLTMARTGDQLQGLKKGTIEVADVIAVNKADGPAEADSRAAAHELAAALRMVDRERPTPVVPCSALTGAGVDAVWAAVLAHRSAVGPDGLVGRRAAQRVATTWALVRDELDRRLTGSPAVEQAVASIRPAVEAGSLSSSAAADRILAAWDEETGRA